MRSIIGVWCCLLAVGGALQGRMQGCEVCSADVADAIFGAQPPPCMQGTPQIVNACANITPPGGVTCPWFGPCSGNCTQLCMQPELAGVGAGNPYYMYHVLRGAVCNAMPTIICQPYLLIFCTCSADPSGATSPCGVFNQAVAGCDIQPD